MPYRPAMPAALLALLLAAAVAPGVAGAQPAPFVARPTEPMDCRTVAGSPDLWQGSFRGRKEMAGGPFLYRNVDRTLCFAGEQDCRNWLYNMQSEYTVMVWRAECRPAG